MALQRSLPLSTLQTNGLSILAMLLIAMANWMGSAGGLPLVIQSLLKNQRITTNSTGWWGGSRPAGHPNYQLAVNYGPAWPGIAALLAALHGYMQGRQ